MQYEIIAYKYGSGIYNQTGSESRFRHGIDEKAKFTINTEQIFEDKLPTGKITYIYQNGVTEEPVINAFFVSDASLKRFLQQNPLIKKRIGKDYFLNIVVHSHRDCRATV